METAVDTTNRLKGEIIALRRSLDALGVSPELVQALRALDDQVELTVMRAVDALGDTIAFGDLGYANAGAWMADQCNTFRSEPAVRDRQAAVLAELPLFAAALEEGCIGMAHLKMLVPIIKAERLSLAARDEQVLLNAALTLDPHRFAVAVRQWAALCDDELNDPTDDDARQRHRSFRCNQLPDGCWKADGILDPLAGEAMSRALEAHMAKPAPDDDRTVTQRRHDALADIMSDVLNRGDRPMAGGERPHVTITLKGDVAVTSAGTVLPDYLRDTICCDATFTKVQMSTSGVPFDVGTPESSIPIRNRRAVIARDEHCRYPGCDRPARWSDVHHLTHRCNQGNHQISNLVLLCRHHHQLIHRQQLLTWLDHDEITLLIEWPNGTLLRSPPSTSLVG